jgi:uncharacterized protein (TIGR02145 family)
MKGHVTCNLLFRLCFYCTFFIGCNLDRVEDEGPFICGQDFTDPRDGKIYKTVWIAFDGSHDLNKAGKCWMAENLNFNTGNAASSCYDEQAINCDTFGRLYTQYLTNTCVNGWHVATSEEWRGLFTTYGWTDEWTGLAYQLDGPVAPLLPGGTSRIDLLMGGSCEPADQCTGIGQSVTFWPDEDDYYCFFNKNGTAAVGILAVSNPPPDIRYYIRCVKDE